MESTLITNILIPYDFSPASEKALFTGLRYAHLFRAQPHVVHVVENNQAFRIGNISSHKPNDETKHVFEELQRKINSLLLFGKDQVHFGRDIITEVIYGKVINEIVDYSDGNDIDLIVLGIRQKSGVASLLMNDTAWKIAKKVSCEVLWVKYDEDQKMVTPLILDDKLPAKTFAMSSHVF